MHIMPRNHKSPLKTLGPLAASLVTTLHERNQMMFGVQDVKAIGGLNDASAISPRMAYTSARRSFERVVLYPSTHPA